MWKLGRRNIEDLHLFLHVFVGSYCYWLFLFGIREVLRGSIGFILVFVIVWGRMVKMKGRLIDLLKNCLKCWLLLFLIRFHSDVSFIVHLVY